MPENTKLLFGSILRMASADCVCDIGSRDGDQALFFKHLLPEAKVFAFEANPINFKTMLAKPSLREAGIELHEKAVSNENGIARFNIVDVDYDDPNSNKGISSLLARDDLKVKMKVEVPSVRIDDFIAQHCPKAERVGLWIDVEGAEHMVLSGLTGLGAKVVAIHVECSREAKWQGQKTYPEIEKLLVGLGFEPLANNMTDDVVIADFVFIHKAWAQKLGPALRKARLKGKIAGWLRIDNIAVTLKTNFPGLYRFARRMYMRVGT